MIKMKKLIILASLLFITNFIFSQSMTFEYEKGKRYCTIEIDTTSLIHTGALKALNYFDVLYYEMAFHPVFEYDEDGSAVLYVVPSWHYYAYLEKIYGEVEKAKKDRSFALKYKIDPVTGDLTMMNDASSKRRMFMKSSFKEKKFMDFTLLPKTFRKANTLNEEKYPKGLKRELDKREKQIRSRYINAEPFNFED